MLGAGIEGEELARNEGEGGLPTHVVVEIGYATL